MFVIIFFWTFMTLCVISNYIGDKAKYKEEYFPQFGHYLLWILYAIFTICCIYFISIGGK